MSASNPTPQKEALLPLAESLGSRVGSVFGAASNVTQDIRVARVTGRTPLSVILEWLIYIAAALFAARWFASLGLSRWPQLGILIAVLIAGGVIASILRSWVARRRTTEIIASTLLKLQSGNSDAFAAEVAAACGQFGHAKFVQRLTLVLA